jgi:hypothetical protein
MLKLHMFHALVLISNSVSLLSFQHHNPLFVKQQPNPEKTDATVHAADGTTRTLPNDNDSTKVPRPNRLRFITTFRLHNYNSYYTQITTYFKLFCAFQITTPAPFTHNVSAANPIEQDIDEQDIGEQQHNDRIDVTPTQASVPEKDDIDIVDDDGNEFNDDEKSFILMTPAVTLSQQIATQTKGSPVSFQKLMMNMLGDML